MKEIRKLEPQEIDLRVGATTANGKGMLLLYKDARCDMALLDEVFGIGNWQSEYIEIKGVLFCKVGVRASATAKGNEQPLPVDDWVWKMSNGVESQGTGDDDPNNVKGEASDAFKRSCFMWGIGRELYEWKNIWINYDKTKDKYEKFFVSKIEYTENGQPKYLQIVNSKNETVYSFSLNGKKPQDTKQDRSETLPQSTNQHTTIQEKAPTSENNGVKPKDTQYAKETTTILSEEEAKNEVKKTNRQIWDCLIDVVENYCAKEKINDEEKNEGIKTGITKFFTDKLKISIKQLELSETNRKPLVQGNVVVVYDMNLLKDFQDFLGKEIFLPF